jgi:hypothetical protein
MDGGLAPAVPALLDAYAATAVIAASIRKLFSTATNSFRVRRSSDNAESDIGFIGNDLNTAALAAFVGANQGVAPAFYNQVNPANNLGALSASYVGVVNSGTYLGGVKTANSGPVGFASTLNASTVVAGMTLFMKLVPDNIGAGAAYTYFYQGADGSGVRITVSQNDITNGNYDCWVRDGTGSYRGFNAAISVGGNVLAVRVTFGNPPVVKVWKDNVVAGTAINSGTPNVAAMAAREYRWGANAFPGAGANCLYKDVVVYESALSDADVGAINTLLMT